MNVVILMLAVTACYTICSLNDKYAAAKANLSGDEFTFLMCSSMSVFLAASLPFQNLSFSFTSVKPIFILPWQEMYFKQKNSLKTAFVLKPAFQKKCVDFVHIAEYLQPRCQAQQADSPVKAQNTLNHPFYPCYCSRTDFRCIINRYSYSMSISLALMEY